MSDMEASWVKEGEACTGDAAEDKAEGEAEDVARDEAGGEAGDEDEVIDVDDGSR